jgi:hypothetical protein
MDANLKGCFVYTSSASAVLPSPFAVSYASTKAFLSMFAISLAPEVKWLGIDVLAVHPSPVASRRAQHDAPGGRRAGPRGLVGGPRSGRRGRRRGRGRLPGARRPARIRVSTPHILTGAPGRPSPIPHPTPRFYDGPVKIGMMEAFRKLAVAPEDLPDIIFASIGRTIWKDVGGVALGFRCGGRRAGRGCSVLVAAPA